MKEQLLCVLVESFLVGTKKDKINEIELYLFLFKVVQKVQVYFLFYLALIQ
jgi:hypothetical protein